MVGAFEGELVQASRHCEEAARAVKGAEPFVGVEHREVRVDERVADGTAGGDARVAHDYRTIGGDAGSVGFVARAEEAQGAHCAGLVDEGLGLIGGVEALADNHRTIVADRASDGPAEGAAEFAEGGVGASGGTAKSQRIAGCGTHRIVIGITDGDQAVARNRIQLRERESSRSEGGNVGAGIDDGQGRGRDIKDEAIGQRGPRQVISSRPHDQVAVGRDPRGATGLAREEAVH